MDVACCGDADRFRHTVSVPQEWNPHARVPTSPVPDDFESLLSAMKRAAAVLRDGEIPFALAGGLAGYARGGPPPLPRADRLGRAAGADGRFAVREGVLHAGRRARTGGMKIAITGATGNVGTALLRALADEPAVESIVGIARRLPREQFPKTC